METNYNMLLPMYQKINLIRMKLSENNEVNLRKQLIIISNEFGILNIISFNDFTVRLTITDVITKESLSFSMSLTPKYRYDEIKTAEKTPIYEYTDMMVERVINLAYSLTLKPEENYIQEDDTSKSKDSIKIVPECEK